MVAQKIINRILGDRKSKNFLEYYDRTGKYPMCVVCKKKRGKEEYGGHLCSSECETKYVENEEKYF
jgi:hypothetical protein